MYLSIILNKFFFILKEQKSWSLIIPNNNLLFHFMITEWLMWSAGRPASYGLST